jgi:hypothetical protein
MLPDFGQRAGPGRRRREVEGEGQAFGAATSVIIVARRRPISPCITSPSVATKAFL